MADESDGAFLVYSPTIAIVTNVDADHLDQWGTEEAYRAAFSDFLAGSLPAATGRKMRFSGTTVIKVVNGKIAEEIGLDDGVTALTQLGILRRA